MSDPDQNRDYGQSRGEPATARERIQEYCRKNPEVLERNAETYALAEEQIFRVSQHPEAGRIDVTQATGYELVVCSQCRRITEHVDSMTACCRAPIPGSNL